MLEKSRTEYSVLNTTVSMVSRILTIFLGYIARVIFTRTLGQNYVGISGLFLNIINVLSLSELGVGTAITYALYKPIAENDIEKQKSYMCLYRKFYQAIGGIVFGSGLLVIPFMDILIKNKPDIPHLTLVYLLYLLSAAGSYLFVYKKTLIDAHQKSYISILYYSFFIVLQYILQIIILLCTKNFILYLVIYLLCTFGNNIAVSRKAEKMFPYLREKDAKLLTKDETNIVYRNTKAMMLHKMGDIAVNNTDNLLLSALVGLQSVASYSHYFLLIGSVNQVLNQMFQGITASVGNLGASENNDKIKEVFEISFFVGFWLFGFSAICLFELLNPFIELSFGREYLFATNIVFVLCLNFYLTGMRQATLVFRNSLGLFWNDRYRSVVEAVINLVVSIVLGIRMGTLGVFLGTFISTVAVPLWLEPLILYKYRIRASIKNYFWKYALYTLLILLAGGVTHVVCGTHNFIIRIIICGILPNVLIGIVMHRTKEFRYVMNMVIPIIRRRFGWK